MVLDKFMLFISSVYILFLIYHLFTSFYGAIKFKKYHNGKRLFKIKKKEIAFYTLLSICCLFLTIICFNTEIIYNIWWLIYWVNIAIFGITTKFATYYTDDMLYINGKIIEIIKITRIDFNDYAFTGDAVIYVSSENGKEKTFVLRYNKEDKEFLRKIIYKKYGFYKC